MKVLGLGFTQHECSAALVINGELRTAIARERITRIKRDGSAWGSKRLDLGSAIQYCLQANDLALSDIDLVVYHHVAHIAPEELKKRLLAEGGLDFFSLSAIALPHHFAHACCTFYLSPFEEAAIFVTDGAGGPPDLITRNCSGPEASAIAQGLTMIQNIDPQPSASACEYESFYSFGQGKWETWRKTIGIIDGIGAVYSRASRLLFKDGLDSGKTMGLSSYSTPSNHPIFFEKAGPEEMPFFRASRHNPSPERQELEQRIKEILAANSDPSKYEEPELTYYAASLQKETEDVLIEYARWLQQKTGLKNLCLCGGVALNCVANSRIWEEAGFEQVFVPPCPGDDGLAIGCALYGAALHNELKMGKIPVFGGRSYHHDPSELAEIGLTKVYEDENVYEVIAQEIAKGAVIAWYQEGSEFGPRALGHRSFLADPRRGEMKDYLNLTVKNRENFRPFAPVVLEEQALDYFDKVYPSYCMSFVARVREEKQAVVPAITHVDGTARYQVLRQEHNPQLYELIRTFAKHTGVPILLNTSLNRAGEPLVETPLDAGLCAIKSSVDYLVIDGAIYQPVKRG
jgi:carbamoyltransferase